MIAEILQYVYYLATAQDCQLNDLPAFFRMLNKLWDCLKNA